MRQLRFILALLAALLPLGAACAAPSWDDYAAFAQSFAPLPPTPTGEGHLGRLESGATVQLRFPVPTSAPTVYRVNLPNVVPYAGTGTSYQLIIRRDAADGAVIYQGPVIRDSEAWSASNREPIDLTSAVKASDLKQGFLDLFVTAQVQGDGWTLYRQSGARAMSAQAVVVTAARQRQIETNQELQRRGLALLPFPQRCSLRRGEVGLQGIGLQAKPSAAMMQMLFDRYEEMKLAPPAIYSIVNIWLCQGALSETELPNFRRMGFAAKPSGHSQGYTLEANSKGVLVIGDDAAGLFYGTQTLCQLLRNKGGRAVVPQIMITDWPAYALRGFQYDIARGQTVDVEYCKRLIRESARYKMNAIMFYMEDDFKFEKYPFTGRPGTFTKAKAQELSRYADQYHVMLIPQYESLGHAGAVLSHPEFKDLRENGRASIFCTCEPKVWEFLDDAYAELAEAFPNSRYLHVGGDEFETDFGKCPRCQAFIAREGLGGLYAWHMNRLNELCRKHHRIMMFWPSHAGGDEEHSWLTLKNADKLQRNCIPTEWIYHGPPSYPSIAEYQQAGFLDVCVSPAVVSYSVIWPDYPTTFRAIKGFYQAGAARGCGKALCTTWEFMGGALLENSLHGLIYAAECGWSLGSTSRQDYARRFAVTWLGATDPAATALVEQSIYLPLPEFVPGILWRNQELVRSILWASPQACRRQFIQRDPAYLQTAPTLLTCAKRWLDNLQRLRTLSTTNQRTVDFALLGARMYEYVGTKLLAVEAATQAYAAAKTKLPGNSAAAADQVTAAATALMALQPRLAALQKGFQESVEHCGGYPGDLKAIQAQSQELKSLIGTLTSLAADLKAGKTTQLLPAQKLGLSLAPLLQAGSWTPAQMSEQDTELRYDITALLKEAGNYHLEWEYTQGAHGLAIKGVRLLLDGRQVAEDIHRGYAGAGTNANVYDLKLDTYKLGGRYEVVATVASNGGIDSSGDIWLTMD